MGAGVTSIVSSGSVAGAAASGATIATLSHTNQVTQKGMYRITAYGVIGAGPGANDTNNIVVAVGSSTVVLPAQPVAGAAVPPVSFDVSLDGATDVVAKVGGLASVAPYSVVLVAEWGGPNGALLRR